MLVAKPVDILMQVQLTLVILPTTVQQPTFRIPNRTLSLLLNAGIQFLCPRKVKTLLWMSRRVKSVEIALKTRSRASANPPTLTSPPRPRNS